MNRAVRMSAIAIALLAVGGAAGFFSSRWYEGRAAESAPAHGEPAGEGAAPGAKEEEPETVATVRVAPVRRGEFTLRHEFFGSITPRPGAAAVVALPVEVVVKRVAVIKGQRVATGDVLAEVQPSPEGVLQLGLAKSGADSARQLLEAVLARQALTLATKQDVIVARQNAAEAQMKLDRLMAAMPAADGLVHAQAAGLVSDVRVQAGGLAVANMGLVELIPPDGVVATLATPAAEARARKIGETVKLFAIGDASETAGVVEFIGPGPNPTTRMTDVLVRMTGEPPLPLGSMVRGVIEEVTPDALLVPREAVLPDDEGWRLYLIKDGHAVEKKVRAGGDDRHVVRLLEAAGVEPGDSVVVLGQYELHEGTRVSVEAAP